MVQSGIMSIYGGLVPLGFTHSNCLLRLLFHFILLKIAYHTFTDFTTTVFHISWEEILWI